MSDDNKKRPRNTRDISTELEEENLWDLEDDWDEENSDQSSVPAAEAVTSTKPEKPEKAQDNAELKIPVDKKHVESETEEPTKTEENILLVDEELTDHDQPIDAALDSEPEDHITEEKPEPISSKPLAETEAVLKASEPENKTEEPSPQKSESHVATAAMVVKKLSLSPVEKISLLALSTCLLGLVIWGYFWLVEKNKMADTRETVELPVEGKHTTITELSTFWITPEKKSGVNMNAVIVPAISITLDKDSGKSGALRIYFRDDSKNSIGDTITLKFDNGQFSNDSNSIEVSASDGFHTEGRFHAYQVDSITPWRVVILEAPSVSSPGSDFNPLVDAPVEAVRK